MFVEFDLIQDSSRVWVYQSERKLVEAEKSAISRILLAFTQQWVAHGQPLKSSFKILYEQFIVLTADESYAAASGCSIDDSVHAIKEIDMQFKLNLFDRTKIAFLQNEQVMVLSMSELSKALEQGKWKQETLVFNNVISTKGDLKSTWLLPAANTWLKRYLNKVTV